MLRSLIWKYFVRRTAQSHGLLDPSLVLSHVTRFSQPSEVAAPIELLRSAYILHSRGLVNSQGIQHNLDWVWPYWVKEQFNPTSISFIPRAFSLTHINLTHRNWTAVGLPYYSQFPIIDPRGLVTPFLDGWSIDGWLVKEKESVIVPSSMKKVEQTLNIDGTLEVKTKMATGPYKLETKTWMEEINDLPVCKISYLAHSTEDAYIAVSLRPYNPEGISFIYQIQNLDEEQGWLVNKESKVLLDSLPQRIQYSQYRKGDVFNQLFDNEILKKIECDIGMATAAALFKVKANEPKEVIISIPLKEEKKEHRRVVSWDRALDHVCTFEADHPFKKLYDIALTTLVLHSSKEILAGPYTYKHFWFRDAAFIAHALLCVGLKDRAKDTINYFPARQTAFGYFHSQDGEWDSNGEVLWVLRRYIELTGEPLPETWKDVISKAARWIKHKRLSPDIHHDHAGLLPSGFSAEHLGPNDFYYWDDFWSVEGFRSAAVLLRQFNETKLADEMDAEGESLLKSIEKSLNKVEEKLGKRIIPASVYRRMDSGAIGSICAGYPLDIYSAQNEYLLNTVHYLMDNCLVEGGFFHDMSHSGINPYLTLHIAQILLQAGDIRFLQLMNSLSNLASPTGQWPEAMHPQTKGGCMGDGQHVWAAAEWILMIRNCFLREEKQSLTLCSGITPEWFKNKNTIKFGWAPTKFGPIQIKVMYKDKTLSVSWEAKFSEIPNIKISLPGQPSISVQKNQTSAEILLV